MLVEYLSEVSGGPGTVVPWYNVWQDLFPHKVTPARVSRALGRMKSARTHENLARAGMFLPTILGCAELQR